MNEMLMVPSSTCSAKVYSIDALLDDCHSYFLATKRRISFEYTLLEVRILGSLVMVAVGYW